MDRSDTVYAVVEALEQAHREVSPECHARIGNLRMTRPDDWLKAAADLP